MNKQEVDRAKRYIRDMVSGSLFVRESRIVAQSLMMDPSGDEWLSRIIADNPLHKKSSLTIIRYARTIQRRLEPLGLSFMQTVSEVEDPFYTQLLMLALLTYTPVVGDFMSHVVAETRRIHKPCLDAYAWDDFLQDRRHNLPGLNELSESTLQKTGTNLIRTLVEAGYLDNNKNRKLLPVYVLPETRIWLRELNFQNLEKIMECTL